MENEKAIQAVLDSIGDALKAFTDAQGVTMQWVVQTKALCNLTLQTLAVVLENQYRTHISDREEQEAYCKKANKIIAGEIEKINKMFDEAQKPKKSCFDDFIKMREGEYCKEKGERKTMTLNEYLESLKEREMTVDEFATEIRKTFAKLLGVPLSVLDKAVDIQPDADVVAVTRCKDCRRWTPADDYGLDLNGNKRQYGECSLMKMSFREDNFCCFGSKPKE